MRGEGREGEREGGRREAIQGERVDTKEGRGYKYVGERSRKGGRLVERIGGRSEGSKKRDKIFDL